MAASARPNLGLTAGWADGESGWGLGMNENLERLDVLTMGAIKDKDLTAPPGSPADGDSYIVATSPTGAWAGQAGKIAHYVGGLWTFYTPREGWIVWADDENALYAFDGSAWAILAGGGGGGGGTGYIWVDGSWFRGDSAASERSSGGHYESGVSLFGTSDREEVARFVVPGDFSSLTAMALEYVNTGTSSNPFVIIPGFRNPAAAADVTGAPTNATASVITPPTTADRRATSALNIPAVTLTPGDIVTLVIARPASSNGSDTNTDAMFMRGVLLTYTKA